MEEGLFVPSQEPFSCQPRLSDEKCDKEMGTRFVHRYPGFYLTDEKNLDLETI